MRINSRLLALLYFFLTLTFCSCDEKKKNISIETKQLGKKETIKTSNVNENDNNKNDYYENFKVEKENTIENLKNISKSDANNLYVNYCKINAKIINKINENEQIALEKFYYDDANSKNIIRKLNTKLLNIQLRFEEIGEGYVEITTIPDFYYNIFKNYVTEDYNEYLYLISEENKSLYSADAGLAITFKELGDRIISWENFIKKYPKSELVKEVKLFLKNYQYDYIFGLDNTLTFERDFKNQTETNKKILYINDENNEEFKRYLKLYPNSPTSKLINLFIENYKDKQEEEVFKLIRNEINKN